MTDRQVIESGAEEVIGLPVAQCAHTDVYGRADCSALIDRRYVADGLCKAHDNKGLRAGKERRR